jgi:hypothetical protein
MVYHSLLLWENQGLSMSKEKKTGARLTMEIQQAVLAPMC